MVSNNIRQIRSSSFPKVEASDAQPSTSNVRQTRNVVINENNNRNVSRIRSTDYASWDKYDPDTEMLKMDLKEEKLKKSAGSSAPKKRGRKHIKFNNFATEAEATFEANKQREMGNECFKAGEYDAAIMHYTSSLECKETVHCYNNRSMAYIKQGQYDMAVDDCDSALVLDPKNFKSNYRKALALERLGRLEEAYEFNEECVKIDPNNTAVQELAERLRRVCGVQLEKKKRFQIEDVQWGKRGILRDTRRHDRYWQRYNEVLIPIPGSSRMPEPYFVVCDETDAPNVIYQIQNRSKLLGIVTVPKEEDEDCTVNHLNHICSKSDTERELKRDNVTEIYTKTSQNERKTEEYDSNTDCTELNLRKDAPPSRIKLKKTAKTPAEGEQKVQFDDKDAGGEPYNKSDILELPDDIHYPYTFLKIWLSVSHDTTLKKHAHIIKSMNMDQLVRVIGCKLDNDMFTTMLKTLCMHFTVPGEVEKVYAVLVNVANLPRFEIISLLMSEQDMSYVSILINFLHQHDKDLPDDVKLRFQFRRRKS